MKCPIALHAEHLNSPAIIDSEGTLSYRQLDQRIFSLMALLTNQKLPKIAKVAFIPESNVETIALFFALWRLQMIACPLHQRLPEKAIEAVMQRLGASILLRPSQLSHIHEKSNQQDLELKAVATMLFTSGTTSEPKIVCHSIDNHLQNALSAAAALNLTPKDRYLLSLPLSHVGGIAILWRTFLTGAALVISDKQSSLKNLTHLSYVPTQLYRLLQGPLDAIERARHFKCLLIGGAPLSSSLLKRAKEEGLNIFTSYGMTEMSSLIALNGIVLPHARVKIVEGEIFVKGESLFQGYLKDQTELHRPLEEGWFSTKDLGEVTDQGLKIMGRKDHLFISGGENIQPAEIERALLELPGIEQAIVRGHADPEFGMVGHAYLFDAGKTWDESLLRKKLNELLPSYKIPKKIFFLDEPIP